MEVRVYKKSDAGAVRRICHATAKGKRYLKSGELVCALYCDYYIENEPENCFVLTDEFDKAVGYVLSCANDVKYEDAFKPYLKKTQKLSLIETIGYKIERKLTKKIRAEYPAHLHIDILPSFQGVGGGRMLINTLKKRLKEIGVTGIHLTVAASNKGAAAFYERLGFEKAKKIFNIAYVYTIKL